METSLGGELCPFYLHLVLISVIPVQTFLGVTDAKDLIQKKGNVIDERESEGYVTQALKRIVQAQDKTFDHITKEIDMVHIFVSDIIAN